MLSVPRIPVGLARLDWQLSSSGGLAYEVRGQGSSPARLNTGMLAIALLADGQRSLGDIADALADNGLLVDDPAKIVLTFFSLEQAGAVAMKWHYEQSGEIRHECVACGQSCEGHLIGSLPPAQIDRLFEIKEELKALEPDLPDIEPIMKVDDADDESLLALNTSSGRCVFLTSDRKCAIHRHFGAEAKPVACRLFPLRVIQTEAGFRVGISSRCVMSHRSFDSAPPATARQAVESNGFSRPPGKIVGLDSSAPRSLKPTEAFQRNAEQEAYFLALLSQPGVELTSVIASATGAHRRAERLPRGYLADVRTRLHRFPERYEASPLNLPGTHYGDQCRQVLADFAALSDEPPAWREPDNPVRAFLIQSLRQFVFLRETVAFPTVEIGVHVALIGVIGALWTAREWHDGGAVSDDLGSRVSHWLRMINVANAHRFLYEGPEDFDRYRSLL